jgi:hypothetical protein
MSAFEMLTQAPMPARVRHLVIVLADQLDVRCSSRPRAADAAQKMFSRIMRFRGIYEREG